MRTITQIAVTDIDTLALCNDGSLFRWTGYDKGWVQLPPIPQPDNAQSVTPQPLNESQGIAKSLVTDDFVRDYAGKTAEQARAMTPESIAKLQDVDHDGGGMYGDFLRHGYTEYTPTEWPEGAMWWAVDMEGTAYFYAIEPEYINERGTFESGGYRMFPADKNYPKFTIKDWRTSKRKRPV